MQPQCTCKGCTARFVGCHSQCEKYAAFLAKRQAERAERLQKTSVYREQAEYTKAVHRKIEQRERRSKRR